MKKICILPVLLLFVLTVQAQTVIKGDVNNDKQVGQLDVKETSNAILGKPSANYNAANADVNGDKKVNAADIVSILNIIIANNDNYHYKRIVLTKKDGGVETFDFADKPVVTYIGNDLVVTTSKTRVQTPVFLLKGLTFDDGWMD